MSYQHLGVEACCSERSQTLISNTNFQQGGEDGGVLYRESCVPCTLILLSTGGGGLGGVWRCPVQSGLQTLNSNTNLHWGEGEGYVWRCLVQSGLQILTSNGGGGRGVWRCPFHSGVQTLIPNTNLHRGRGRGVLRCPVQSGLQTLIPNTNLNWERGWRRLPKLFISDMHLHVREKHANLQRGRGGGR